ncbi:helix-turn-helix transcriptional regulator [Fuscovulum ytuae]|uniref:Helix-turn-helix transcriptional regulator n=1 Tax=Fuscovulum ytuae TaxID=3042299 RepID=A0ABY8Q6Y0_9RHOB|nr:helix-turn-helix transcriptional regulator [Fuscovulum sp. YMD61]WGV15962.1 helix-turn-helix transcriptional regulator [Fuscovulum sp. YMD61]
MKPSAWAPLAGAVVGVLETSDLPSVLTAFLRQTVPYSYTVIFGYRGTARPIDLHDDFPMAKRKIFVTDYQAGPYLLDPFYLASLRGVEPGLYRLRDLAPDRFYQGEYYRSYYAQTGLAEEIAYFVDLPEQSTLVLSLMRTERPFSQREFKALEAVFPFVASVVRRQWKTLCHQFGKGGEVSGMPRPQRDIVDDLGSFGAGVLTAREREVAAFTLKGHSAESTGQILGISPGTVRIHRRNIYAKLRINSQGELFSRFLRTLSDGP